jgi:RNA polymerase sigma-70 factor (ECF subfamily)
MNKSTVEEFSLEDLRLGNKHEFARLVEAYSGIIFRLAYKMMDNEQDAEDVLQETFIKAYRGLKNFDGRSSLSTWLYRIAVNESLMTLRKRRSAAFSMDEILDSDQNLSAEEDLEPRQFTDWCCLPEDELLSGEARQYLYQAIHRLPYSLRIVFILRDLEGLSTSETSDVLKISETAVKTRLSRARFRLREGLSGYFNEKNLPGISPAISSTS